MPEASNRFLNLYSLPKFMYHTLKKLPIETYLDTKCYCLAIFRCGEENDEKAVVLIEKSSGEYICELLEDKDGFVGGNLGKAYIKWEQEKLEAESLEIVMRLFFRSEGSNIDKVFDDEVYDYAD